MDTFNELLKVFASSKKDFYLNFQDKMNGSKIHLPVPVLVENDNYCLKALVHYLWASLFISQPYKIVQIYSNKIEYLDLHNNTNLEKWRGPIFDAEFEFLEERLLLISEEVFECYRLRMHNLLVEEYAQTFFKVTPPEFVFYYEQIAQDFIRWIKN